MSDEPVPVLDRLNDYLDFHAASSAGWEAVVSSSVRIDYRQLRQDVESCARSLLAAGLHSGDRVAVLSTPRAEFWIIFLATLRIGAIWVGVNPRYRLEEVRYLLRDCEPALLFSISDFEGRDYAGELRALQESLPSIRQVVAIGDALQGATSFEEFLALGDGLPDPELHARAELVTGSSPAAIVYTSGTSGQPKGAVLSQAGLARGALMQTRHLKIERPALLVNFPINHVACIADTCATTLVRGGKIVFQERFDPAESLRAVATERCNLLGGVPTMLMMQMDLPEFGSFDLSSIELIAWGGAAMPREGIQRLSRVAKRLMCVYGLTETSANVVYCDDSSGVDALATAIGRPDPDVLSRIVSEVGAECPPGEAGEIQLKADFFFLGYWNRPQATRDAFTDDGWFRTGDIGFLRADGNLQLVGRRSDMYKSGGYNVYPREIELALEALPEVSLAAVIGVPDSLYQEVGHAFLTLKPGCQADVEALRQACRDRMANYKVPRHITVLAELPMLPVGKVDKRALRSMLPGA